MKTLIILMGLPGSGKSRWAEANKKVRNFSYQSNVIDLDKKNIEYNLHHISLYFFKLFDEFIIDGLFLNEEKILQILNNSKIKKLNPEVKIMFFVPDKKQSLFNDSLRIRSGERSKDSTITIEDSTIEKPDVKNLIDKSGLSNISIIDIETYVPNRFDIFCVDYKLDYSGKRKYNKIKIIKEEKHYNKDWESFWRGSCDDNESSCNTDEFDEILSEICPDIKFLQYKKLKKECIEFIDEDYYDYYDRGTIHYWLLNTKKLWEMLNEMGYI